LRKHAYTINHKIAVLEKARALLTRPHGWIQGTWYHRSFREKTVKGQFEFVAHEAFCLAGACNEAAIELGYEQRPDTHERGICRDRGRQEIVGVISLHDLVHKKGYSSVVQFNDHRRLDGFGAAPTTKRKDVIGVIDERLAMLYAEREQRNAERRQRNEERKKAATKK
jgi:hypothetical protein